MQLVQHAFFAAAAFALVACTPLPPEACSPNEKIACSGTDGCRGVQVCDDDGFELSECRCEDGADMDGSFEERADSGMQPMDGGDSRMDASTRMDSGVRSDASIDAGGDAAMQRDAQADAADGAGPDPVFGPFDCNPVSNEPCDADERCAWVAAAEDPGTHCIEDGELAKGATCEMAEVGEADDCERGTTCVGSCENICLLDGTESCEDDEYCVGLSGRFRQDGGTALAGACLTGCNPITQLTEEDEPCGENKGCFVTMNDGVATCVKASQLTQDQPITGPAYSNACAAGFTPVYNAAGVLVCTAHCDPAETYMGSSENLGGEGPHTCAARGANAPYECRFAWIFNAFEGNDPRINDIGICLDPTGRTYGVVEGDATVDTPWPSCADLPNTDTDGDGLAEHYAWGCAPMAL